MKSITYFAVFEPTKTGYSVYFPDLAGCITIGESINETLRNSKETLGLHLWGMEKDNEDIPNPTFPPFEDVEPNAFVVPIEVYPEYVKNEMDNRAVKKTLTIPHWLNVEAEKVGVNFSQLLQKAIKQELELV